MPSGGWVNHRPKAVTKSDANHGPRTGEPFARCVSALEIVVGTAPEGPPWRANLPHQNLRRWYADDLTLDDLTLTGLVFTTAVIGVVGAHLLLVLTAGMNRLFIVARSTVDKLLTGCVIQGVGDSLYLSPLARETESSATTDGSHEIATSGVARHRCHAATIPVLMLLCQQGPLRSGRR